MKRLALALLVVSAVSVASLAQNATTVFEGARSGLIHDDDVRAAVEVVQPGTMAALIVFENRWAAPFVSAAIDAGGELIASPRIPAARGCAAGGTGPTAAG